jgi:hypothetical protein
MRTDSQSQQSLPGSTPTPGGAEDFLEGPDAFNAESDAHHAVA